jgi:hypothetical protein
MTAMWLWVLGACAIAYLTKLSGFLVPDSLLERPWVTTVSAGMTVGLLTSLVLANTVVTGTSLVLDARLVVPGRGSDRPVAEGPLPGGRRGGRRRSGPHPPGRLLAPRTEASPAED